MFRLLYTGYGQGSYLGAAYGNPYAGAHVIWCNDGIMSYTRPGENISNEFSCFFVTGSKNGQNAGVQPDYAGQQKSVMFHSSFAVFFKFFLSKVFQLSIFLFT